MSQSGSHGQQADEDGNAVLVWALQSLAPRPIGSTRRALKPFVPLITPLRAPQALDVRPQNVWVRPGQSSDLGLFLGHEAAGMRMLKRFGTSVFPSFRCG